MVAVKEITWEEASAPDFEHTTRHAFRAAVDLVAARAKATLPECNGRVEKAVAIVLAGDVQLLPDGHARVASQCQGTTQYRIVNGTCDCPDFPRAPASWCKHRIASGIHRRALQAVQTQAAVASVPAVVPTVSAPAVAPEHIVELHGKRFVTFAGLLALAHARGLLSLKARFVSVTGELAIAEAEATFQDGRVFCEAADATPANVGAKVKAHYARMALTRAKARCLRDALGVDLVSLEELD